MFLKFEYQNSIDINDLKKKNSTKVNCETSNKSIKKKAINKLVLKSDKAVIKF